MLIPWVSMSFIESVYHFLRHFSRTELQGIYSGLWLWLSKKQLAVMHTFGWFFNDQPVTKVVSLQDDSRLPNPCSSAVRETNESTDHCESLCFHSCPPGYHLFEINLYWSWFFWICFAMERAHMLWYMLYDWMATLYIYIWLNVLIAKIDLI